MFSTKNLCKNYENMFKIFKRVIHQIEAETKETKPRNCGIVVKKKEMMILFHRHRWDLVFKLFGICFYEVLWLLLGFSYKEVVTNNSIIKDLNIYKELRVC